jgi:hypothetical protein
MSCTAGQFARADRPAGQTGVWNIRHQAPASRQSSGTTTPRRHRASGTTATSALDPRYPASARSIRRLPQLTQPRALRELSSDVHGGSCVLAARAALQAGSRLRRGCGGADPGESGASNANCEEHDPAARCPHERVGGGSSVGCQQRPVIGGGHRVAVETQARAEARTHSPGLQKRLPRRVAARRSGRRQSSRSRARRLVRGVPQAR